MFAAGDDVVTVSCTRAGTRCRLWRRKSGFVGEADADAAGCSMQRQLCPMQGFAEALRCARVQQEMQ